MWIFTANAASGFIINSFILFLGSYEYFRISLCFSIYSFWFFHLIFFFVWCNNRFGYCILIGSSYFLIRSANFLFISICFTTNGKEADTSKSSIERKIFRWNWSDLQNSFSGDETRAQIIQLLQVNRYCVIRQQLAWKRDIQKCILCIRV